MVPLANNSRWRCSIPCAFSSCALAEARSAPTARRASSRPVGSVRDDLSRQDGVADIDVGDVSLPASRKDRSAWTRDAIIPARRICGSDWACTSMDSTGRAGSVGGDSPARWQAADDSSRSARRPPSIACRIKTDLCRQRGPACLDRGTGRLRRRAGRRAAGHRRG